MSFGARAGRGLSMTTEQMHTLGLIGKDATPNPAMPPPKYPPLRTKPIRLEMTEEESRAVDFLEKFRERRLLSPHYMLTEKQQASEEQPYKRIMEERIELGVKHNEPEIKWGLIPKELHPTYRKRAATDSQEKNITVSKKIKTENIEERLKILEETESKSETKINNANPLEHSDSEKEEEVMEDEDMEEENDYGQAYFDNGENYSDEDDNLDDGPIY